MANECPEAFVDSAIVRNSKEILQSLWTIREYYQDRKIFAELYNTFPV